MKHFKILAKQHGLLTIKPTHRDPATRIPYPDIDIEFHRGAPIWDSSKSKFSDEQLEHIRAGIQEKLDRGDDTYTFLTEDEEKLIAPEVEVREVVSGPRTSQHQAPKKVSDK